jgi:single-stranded-DNA-specific exonuclease
MENFDRFYDAVDRFAAAHLSQEDLVPELLMDAELSPIELNSELLGFIEQLKPFGMGNSEPLFLIRNLLVSSCRAVKDTHLKLKLLRDGVMLDAIGFNMNGRAKENDMVDIVCIAEWNVWNGRETIQLRLKDIRGAGDASGT